MVGIPIRVGLALGTGVLHQKIFKTTDQSSKIPSAVITVAAGVIVFGTAFIGL